MKQPNPVSSSLFNCLNTRRCLLAGATVLCCWSALEADEFNELPQAPTVAATPSIPEAEPQQTTISSVIPPYVDQGVTMLPMRPLCDFLGATTSYHDSIITVSRATTTITLRAGGETAQVQNGSERKMVRLPLPVEERLGTTFLPVRFFAEALGAEIVQGANRAIVIKSGGRSGILQITSPPAYRGGDAARVTIVNHVGRALSLRLTGPQNLAIELGRKQSITRSLPPGVYYYRAASTGMKTIKGVRRLLAGRKATWAWGRRS